MNNRDFVISHMHGKLYVNFTLFPATCSEEFLRILHLLSATCSANFVKILLWLFAQVSTIK